MNDEKSCCCSCSAKPSLDSVATSATRKIEAQLARSVFRIPRMDCPSEELMIRLCLADAPVVFMAFDLAARTLVIDHAGDAAEIMRCLAPLGYGAELQESRLLQGDEAAITPMDEATEAQILWLLLAINFAMFVVEMLAGWWARSAGLIADAADMVADAVVYGIALYAVGKDAKHKLSAARISGLLQLTLALGALTETGRRIRSGSLPEDISMIGISLLALLANISCLALISRHRQGGVHMRASYIFSANDVLANIGVIVAGILVAWTASPWPDWIIGFSIGIMVLIGAIRILRLK